MEEVIAKAGGSASNIPPHPAGSFAMKCIDLIDYGLVDLTWQGVTRKKHRICLRFWCGETFSGDQGDPMDLWVDQFFTLSLHENSALRPFLEAWRGKTFTEDELHGFNVAVLVGVDAWVTIGHNTKGDRTYANILSISRMPPGVESPGEPTGYVRVKDREPARPDSTPTSYDADPHDDLPF